MTTAYKEILKITDYVISKLPLKSTEELPVSLHNASYLKKLNLNTNWEQRSKHYNNLEWVNRDVLLNSVISTVNEFKPEKYLDLGTGTGKILTTVKKNHQKTECWGVDSCEEMLNKIENKDNYILIKNNAENLKDIPSSYFDVVTARMVFHHIENTEKAAKEVFRILKPGGAFIICEGTPPNIESINWYSEMFKYKEKRHTLTEVDLINIFISADFDNITTKTVLIRNCSLNNWLNNSETEPENREMIKKLHYNAPNHIKKAYNMKFENNDCFMDWKFATVYGIKE